MKVILRWLIASFLIFPFLVLIEKSQGLKFPSFAEVSHVFSFTIWQAFLSAVVSLVLGMLGGIGLAGQKKARWFLESVFILPNMVPSLLLIVSAMVFFSRFGSFPFGLSGIVLIHSILNIGLVSVAVARVMEEKLGGISELAFIEGCSKLSFLFVAIGYLKKELLLLFLFVFSMCFTSFAIPLIVGGVSGTTVDVLIYHKIRSQGLWGEAMALAFMQISLVLLLAVLISKFKVSQASKYRELQIVKWPSLMLIPALATFIIVLGMIGPEVLKGIQIISLNELIVGDVFRGLFNSLVVGLFVGAGVVLLLFCICYSIPHGFFQKFLLGYSAPSAAITGFGILLFFDSDWPLIKIITGVVLILLPVVYRLVAEQSFSQMANQVLVAESLGAKPLQVFLEVKLPQVVKAVFVAGGLAAFWAVGDFALSSMVAGQNITLALVTQSLLESYRMEAAVSLVWLLLVLGLILFFFFGGVGRVLDQKLKA